MARRKLTLDDYIYAILDRDDGTPYPHVLIKSRMNSNQFFGAVNHKLPDLIQATSREDRETLEAISKSAVRKRELFNMGEEFIREQYDRVRAGRQAQLYKGTLQHPENIEHLVYYALTVNNPNLVSADRKEVIKAIKSLPTNLTKYLYNIRLCGLMVNAFEREKRGSPLAVLELFDKVYQEKTGDVSLFDLSQKEHLHKWGFSSTAPQSYWQNLANVEEAVYHILTENHPKLSSRNREEVIEAIKGLPINSDYFESLGLCGLMGSAFKKEKKHSPLAILEVFDRAYMKRTKNISLFDLTQKEHLHKWGDNFQAPRSYWQNPANVEEAIYHTLTENNPQFASKDRKEVIDGIKSLTSNLEGYFESIGLSGPMQCAFEREKRGSPLAVLEVFDKVYQEKTGDVSLFDLSQKEHLHKWGDNFWAPQSYWQNPANVEEAIYHTLTEDNTRLGSRDRKEVIDGIKSLTSNLQKYFYRIGLSGLMSEAFEKGKKSSPLAVLEIFDKVYQEKTGDTSLFDLSQEKHLHKWGDNFWAPQSYWQNPANVEEAIYHILTESDPKFASENREDIIKAIKNLPNQLGYYFDDIGLSKIMSSFGKGKQDSPLAALEIFDRAYMKKTGNASLFDLKQKEHLHKWGDNFKAPNSYWKNKANVEEAVYHTLTECHPELASENREEVIEGIKGLPDDLKYYFHRIDLGGLMLQAFKGKKRDSPKAVLEVFDRVYQRETGNQNLDLEFSGQNRLIRK